MGQVLTYSVLTSLDSSQAFDSVSHHILIDTVITVHKYMKGE